MITFYDDLPFTDSSFAAFQWLGARGLNTGYKAIKGAKLNRADAAERLSRILKLHGQTSAALQTWLKEAISQSDIDLTQFAAKVYQTLRPTV